ncbi:MAG: plasmid stabilization system protein ParE [Verrucomicrobiales bacterium]|jgi:plasmid stabilization system protein ParE
MARSFERHPAIKQDLARIRTYIARENKDAANRVVKAILCAITLIKQSCSEALTTVELKPIGAV